MIRRLSFFLIGLVSLLAFSLYGITHIDELKRNPLTAYAASDFILYDDQLHAAFVDWSWGGSRNFQATEQKLSGNTSISYTPSAWSALYLHTENQLPSQDYDTLKFSVRASASGQKFKVFLYDQNNQTINSAHPLSDFGGDPDANSWKTYVIPLTSLNPSLVPIKGIAIQEASGQNQPIIYVDDISLIAKAVPTPTPTATPTPPPATPTPTPSLLQTATTLQTSSDIFTDTLSPNWENWSWSSSVRFDTTSPVYVGSRAIDYKVSGAWGALYLHAKSLVNTSPFTHLSFALRASSENQKYSLVVVDSSNNSLSNPLALSSLGGNPPAGSWKNYSVALSQLNAQNKQISGIILQDASGNAQASLYIDEIKLLSNISSTTQGVSTANPLSGQSFYVKPNSPAKQTADAWRAAGRTADADQMQKIASNPTSLWVVSQDPYSVVNDYVSNAAAQNTLPVLVAYNIPGRDCGQYSTGGSTYEGYKTWINKISDAIGSRKAAVVLEPDALGLGCLQNDNTYSLLRYAAQTLEAKANTSVYINVSTWVDADTMAGRLRNSGIDVAQGFAINTSGFDTTDAMTKYGSTLSSKVGGKHFLIDTSRNGNGPYDPSQPEPWCNPPDRALGDRPSTATGNGLIDAYFWIKVPGESDGTCRGGPSAGQWWDDYALGLAKRARY